MKYLFFLLLSVCLFTACKKDKNGKAGNKRIKSITGGSEKQSFIYDEQKRITHIYYNAAFSLGFEYSPAGVFVQQYGAGDVPDPDRKYDFSIVNGRISTGHKYLPGKVVHNYSYGYDGEGRLTNIYISLRYDGTEYEQHIYAMQYDDLNNVQNIQFKRKMDGENSDSAYIAKTYYNDRSFVSWRDMGFDYFGSAAMGQEHLGYGIVVPFQIAASIYPGNHPLQSVSEDNFNWNPVTNKWIPQASHTYTRPETDYVYDGERKLVEYGGSTIEWE